MATANLVAATTAAYTSKTIRSTRAQAPDTATNNARIHKQMQVVSMLVAIWADTQIDKILANLDLDGIVSQAEALRSGIGCIRPDLADTLQAHGTNIHIPLTFSDGIEWLVRIRQNFTSPLPPGACRLNALSEVAVYRALCAGGVKSPQAWMPPLDPKNPDIAYFFIERITGTDHRLFMRYKGTEELCQADLNAVTQFAKWMLTFEKVSFDAAGSPTLDEGIVKVGPVIESYTLLPSDPFWIGPYKTARERYVDHFARRMQLVLEDKWCVKEDKLQIYLEMLEAKTLVEQCEDKDMDSGPFYLKHAEPKGDHMLCAPSGEISGLIDWEWATLTCKADAFAAPLAFLDKAYRMGGDELTTLERALASAYDSFGRSDLGDFVRGGKKWQRLTDMLDGYPSGINNLVALRKAFVGPPKKAPPTHMKTWMRRAAKRYQADPGVQALLQWTDGEVPTWFLLPSRNRIGPI